MENRLKIYIEAHKILMFILYMEALLEMNYESRIFGILIDRTFLLKEEFLWLMLLQIL